MNADKRSRSFNDHIPKNIEIIDLTNEIEEPPRKRQKSGTPSLEASKPNISQRSQKSISSSHQQAVTTKVAQADPTEIYAPWMSRRPAWYLSNTTSSASERSAHTKLKVQAPNKVNQHPERHKGIDSTNGREPETWTTKDNKRLDRLSISRDTQGPSLSQPFPHLPHRVSTQNSTNSNAGLADESEGLLALFKIGSASPLKFNPNNISPATGSRVDRAPRTQHPQITQEQKQNSRPPPTLPLAPLKHQRGSSSNPDSPRRLPTHQAASTAGAVQSRSSSKLGTPLPSTTVSVVSPTPSAPTQKLATTDQARPARSEPQSPARLSVTVPLPKRKMEKRVLEKKLKGSVEFAKTNLEEVERVLGLNGFSEPFSPKLDEERFRRGAQPKKRVIDRGKVSLDMGHPPQSATSVTQPQPVHPKHQAKTILAARFAERFEPPLRFSNTVDDRGLNGKFQFISEYILRKGVKAVGQIGSVGCECGQRCHSHCGCLQKHFKDARSKREWFELVPQYERRPDGLVVLRDDFIKRYTISDDVSGDDKDDVVPARQRVEITECSDACSCDKSCINRVVQKGRTVPLEIFQTARCGFGVRSTQNLVRGQFIELYLGEVITETELVRREEAAEAGSTSYIYSLDWFSPQQPYHVDGENFGSAMRFVNHSCDPNSGTFTVLNDKSTKQLHHVAFFALRDISAGTEITIDYTPQAAGTTYELNDVDEGMEKCYCGASNCRRMLWLPGKERKARKKVVGRSFDE